MTLERRRLLKMCTAAAGTAMVHGSLGSWLGAAETKRIKAVAFDAFPVFDPRPIFAHVEQLFPGQGNELSNLWRIRQFEYTWLRTVMGQYADFWQVTEDALRFAARSVKVSITPEQVDDLMGKYLSLKAWPDAVPMLSALRKAGLKLGFLSNFTPKMLQGAMESAKVADQFDFVISTDAARTYKPDPVAYRLAIDELSLNKDEILFVAFAGWDAVGAKTFGYPTYWVNRLNQPAEELGVTPDATVNNTAELPMFLGVAE